MITASLLFGISASLDALLVGVSYGIRGIRIRLWQNLAISLVTLLGTCLSVSLGHRMAAFLPGSVSSCAGSFVLVLLGLYYISKWVKTFLKNCRQDSGPHCSTASLSEPAAGLGPLEVLALSMTLSLNNLSAGLSASLAGLQLVPAAISTLACSVLFLAAGNRLGSHSILQLAGRATDLLSGILLIGLGLIQLFL